MYRYRAYGLGIASALPLPELIADDGDGQSARRPDVILRLDAVADAPRLTSDLPDESCGRVTPDEICMTFRRVGSIAVRAGHEIVIDPVPDLDEALCRLFVLGPALGALLHQRGFLVLHASSVVIDRQCVAFVGEKGQGKSTMAGTLNRRGHPLFADDMVAVALRPIPPLHFKTNPMPAPRPLGEGAPLPPLPLGEGRGEGDHQVRPLAYPGFPQLKLWPEAAAQIGADPESLPRLGLAFEKRACAARDRFYADPVELSRVFVLEDGDSESIQPLPPQQAFMNLVRHSYALPVLEKSGSRKAHFQQAIELARLIPVQALVRRRKLELLAEVAAMVEREISRSEAAA
jgi:hypothetical protein